MGSGGQHHWGRMDRGISPEASGRPLVAGKI